MRVKPIAQSIEEQTEVRLTYLKNGYSPLPAHEKMVTMRGWPKIDATEEDIYNWALSTAFRTTAIRIDGDLVAIDVDVNDPDVSDQIMDAFSDAVPVLADAALRFGKGSKFMYLVRCPERPRILASHVWLRNEDQEDDHRVEIFGSGTTRYFTCAGAHTEGALTADGVEIEIEYEWAEGPTPLDTKPDDLIEVSLSDLRKLVDIGNEIMEGAGWTRLQRSRSGELDLAPVFDLTDDMVFECIDGQNRTLEELPAYAKRNQNARCTASWHEPGATNKTRCRITLWHDGSPVVTDFSEFRDHLPVDADKRTTGEKTRDEAAEKATGLGDALKAAGYADIEAVTGEPVSDWFADQVETMLEKWGYMPGQNGSGYAVWLPDASRDKLPLASFRELYAHLFEMGEPGPKGGKPKKHRVVDVWSVSDQRVNVAGYKYKPGVDQRLVEDAGQLWLNNYRPPVLVEKGAHLNVWLSFMEHLTPDEAERDWLHNWIAWKVQHPYDRGAAIVFVSDGEQGTGRGTLFKILRQIFGSENVVGVPYGKLVGTHGQSQFDEWRLDKVLVTCNEASSSEGLHHSGAKRKQYDALKDVVEPGTELITANVKGEKTRTDVSYISLMIASNYADALPIDTLDRRFAVLTTPNKLEEESRLFHDLYVTCRDGMKFSDEFITAIVEHYQGMDPVYADFMKAPYTEAKQEMAELSEGVVERLVRERIEAMGTPDYISSNVVSARVDVALQQRNLSKMSGHVRTATGHMLRAMGYKSKKRVKLNGERHWIYACNGKEAADVHGLSEAELAKLIAA